MNKEILVKHSSAFPVNPDCTPIFLSRGHQQALDGLVQGLRRGYRLQFLSGSPGTGKSAVLTHFRKQMTTLRTVYLNHSFMGGIDDYIDRICRELGLSEPQGTDITDDDLFSDLRSQLIDAGNPLLIVDNAEGIDSTSLEMLDTLSLKLSIPIILSGDCDFEQLASDSDTESTSRRNRAIHLGTMSREETGQYIRHRLNEFDIDNDIFSTDAVDSIHAYSNGTPRLINLLCNNCIILMGLKDKASIDAQMVHETARNKQASGIYPFTAAPADASHTHTPRPRTARLHRARPHIRTSGPEARSAPRHAPDISRPGISEPYISESYDSEPHIVAEARKPARARKLPSLRAGMILLAGVSAGIFLYGSDISKYRGEIDNLLHGAQQLYSSGRTAVQAAVHSATLSQSQALSPSVDSREGTVGSPVPDVTNHDSPAYTDRPEPGQASVAADDSLKLMEEKIRSKEERLDELEARIAALTEKLDTGLVRQASPRSQPEEQVRREESELDQLEAHIAALTEKLDAELDRQASDRQQAQSRSAATADRKPAAADRTESPSQTDDEVDPRTLSPAQKRQLIRNYLERATYELDRGQIQRAHRSIARGLEIDPYNRALQELRRQAYLAE
ncbi:AAA family ATPase [Thiohalobacter thiocyanaticus]|nr:AAA family ATPase [Thiohalobacter thiocyanaticus]